MLSLVETQSLRGKYKIAHSIAAICRPRRSKVIDDVVEAGRQPRKPSARGLTLEAHSSVPPARPVTYTESACTYERPIHHSSALPKIEGQTQSAGYRYAPRWRLVSGRQNCLSRTTPTLHQLPTSPRATAKAGEETATNGRNVRKYKSDPCHGEGMLACLHTRPPRSE